MKVKISAKNLKSATNSIAALQKLGVKVKEEQLRCLFTVKDNVLLVEAAHMGAFLRKRIDCTVLRSGQFGMNLKNLKMARLGGEVTVDYQNGVVSFSTKKVKFELPTDQEASASVNGARPEEGIKSDIQVMVKSSIIRAAANSVSLQPGLKEEDLSMQFRFGKAKKGGGKMEVVGADHFSFGRYLRVSKDIQVKEGIGFSILSSAISTILDEADGEKVGVGSGGMQPGSVARFKSKDTEIFFPTIAGKLLDCERVARDARDGRFGGSFVCERKQLANTVTSVIQVLGGKDFPVLYLTIGKNVQMRARAGSGSLGKALVEAQQLKLGKEKPHTLTINEKYLSDILKRTPEVVPIRIESWNGKHVLLEAEKIEDGLIQFFMAQVTAEQLKEEAS